MYAIVESGGKQYRVEEGLEFRVEKLTTESGGEHVIDKVLLVGAGEDVEIGRPYIDGAKVACEVMEHGRGDKIIVFHKRRRKDSRKKQGHRQDYTLLKVKSIAK